MSYTNDPATSKTSLYIPLDAARLRQARRNKHLTLEEVSVSVSINKMTLLRYESGDIHAIAPERLKRLAWLYEVTTAWLCGISSDQEFITDTGLEITPISVHPSTALGKRIAACLALVHTSPTDKTVSRQ